MKTKSFLIVLLFKFMAFSAFAQDPVTSISATATYLNTDQAALDTMPVFILLMEQRAITLDVAMGSTEGVSKIAAAIGSSEGSNDLFYKEFTIGEDGDFGDGTSCHTQGSTITLGVGHYAGALAYYAEVFAIRTDGTRGEGRRFLIE